MLFRSPILNRKDSSNGRPMICMPTGRPSGSKSHGTFNDGNPVRLGTPVNCMMANYMSSSKRFSITTFIAPTFVAVNGKVGQMNTSTFLEASRNSWRSSMR